MRKRERERERERESGRKMEGACRDIEMNRQRHGEKERWRDWYVET